MYNIRNQSIDKIKLLETTYGHITCVNYGPFDNGYLLVGLSQGVLLAFDIYDLSIIMQEKIFDVAITHMTFEPTNLVFVTSAD